MLLQGEPFWRLVMEGIFVHSEAMCIQRWRLGIHGNVVFRAREYSRLLAT